IGDIDISMRVNIAVFAEYNCRTTSGGRGTNGAPLLAGGIENRYAHVRRGEQVVFAVRAMSQGAKARSNRRKDAALGHELVINIGRGRDQCQPEKTNCRKNAEELTRFSMHGLSDYREVFPVA